MGCGCKGGGSQRRISRNRPTIGPGLSVQGGKAKQLTATQYRKAAQGNSSALSKQQREEAHLRRLENKNNPKVEAQSQIQPNIRNLTDAQIAAAKRRRAALSKFKGSKRKF